MAIDETLQPRWPWLGSGCQGQRSLMFYGINNWRDKLFIDTGQVD